METNHVTSVKSVLMMFHLDTPSSSRDSVNVKPRKCSLLSRTVEMNAVFIYDLQ